MELPGLDDALNGERHFWPGLDQVVSRLMSFSQAELFLSS
jgi:hypothetical protein